MKNLIAVLFTLVVSFNCLAQKKDTVTTASGLKYIELEEGKGPLIKDGQKVKVFYTGKLLSGKKFDSNRGDKAFQFKVGAGEVIAGWDEGLKLMKKGGKGILIVPPGLAYGKEGIKNPDNEIVYFIPPDATLIFDVEVLK